MSAMVAREPVLMMTCSAERVRTTSAVERDFDSLRSDEVSLAENELHAGLTEAVLVHRDETVHHAAFAVAHT